ncbi:MAG: hypothetical protein D6813_15185 [Calditrichaeota bacterium]|nr:MAG: hypothetical protein D6813_15185 [Calditrichota bacterium]
MKCNKDQIIDYLYEELSPQEKAQFEEHLSTCGSCQREVQALTSARNILKALPEEKSNIQIIFEEARVSRFQSAFAWIKQSWPGRILAGFALGLASILVFLALLNFEFTYSEGNFKVRMSLVPRSEKSKEMQGETKTDDWNSPVTHKEFVTWQQESLKLVQQMIQASEQRQREAFNSTLTQVARELESRRLQDLRQVERGLEWFQLSNENRFRQTNKILNNLLMVTQNSETPPFRIKK